jgi:probable HAF family extracellular repeat protein
MAPLAGLPNGATHSEANDVTPDGTSIVGVTNLGTPDATEFEAFRLSNTGELLLLGDLPGGQHLSLATAVSADGRTITGGSMSDAGYDAFAWTPETGMVGLGEALVGMTSSDGRDISADGRVIVGVGYFASGTDGRAFRWTNELGMQLLGVVPGYESGNGATAVSGDGSIIVGTASNDNGNGFANLSAPFVWDKFHGVRNLQQVLEEDYALATELSGWKLMAAVDISADGLSIVGNGVDPDGIQEAWLVRLDRPLTAPEPSTSALLLIIAMSLFTACRRRSRWSLRNTITR